MMATGATAHEPMAVQVEISIENVGWGATVLKEMDALREIEHTCDVALMATNGSTVRAHSEVLSASSSIFEEILGNAKQSNPANDVVIKTTFTYEVLTHVIEFVYKGRTLPWLRDIPEIKRAATVFGIGELLSHCDVLMAQTSFQADTRTVSVPENQYGGSYTAANYQGELDVDKELPTFDDESDDGNGPNVPGYPEVKTTADKKTPRLKATVKYDAEKQTKRYRYNCDLCPCVFGSRQRLENHLAAHTGEKLHKCDICDKRFVQLDYLREHMLSHSSVKPYKCDTCNKSFPAPAHLKRHARMHRKTHSCSICGLKFPMLSRLNRHLKTHMDDTPLDCQDCGKHFQTTSTATAHKKYFCPHRIDKTSEQPIKCEDCGQEYKMAARAENHKKYYCPKRIDKTLKPPSAKNDTESAIGGMNKQNGEVKDEKRYVCNREGCRGNFRLSAQIKRHIKLYHDDPNPINIRDFLKTVEPKPSEERIGDS